MQIKYIKITIQFKNKIKYSNGKNIFVNNQLAELTFLKMVTLK